MLFVSLGRFYITKSQKDPNKMAINVLCAVEFRPSIDWRSPA